MTGCNQFLSRLIHKVHKVHYVCPCKQEIQYIDYLL